jgi:hypothetical protein
MTIQFSIGSDTFSTTNVWTEKSFGWQLDLP